MRGCKSQKEQTGSEDEINETCLDISETQLHYDGGNRTLGH
jgi:hypothetical protein